MAANATGGSGGRSAYNSQVATLKENTETGVQPFVEVTYTSATQGGGQHRRSRQPYLDHKVNQ